MSSRANLPLLSNLKSRTSQSQEYRCVCIQVCVFNVNNPKIWPVGVWGKSIWEQNTFILDLEHVRACFSCWYWYGQFYIGRVQFTTYNPWIISPVRADIMCSDRQTRFNFNWRCTLMFPVSTRCVSRSHSIFFTRCAIWRSLKKVVTRPYRGSDTLHRVEVHL